MNTCDATVLLLGIELGRCGDPAEGLFAGGCEHEHVKNRWLCNWHASSRMGMCRECYDLPLGGHECPILLRPAAVTS